MPLNLAYTYRTTFTPPNFLLYYSYSYSTRYGVEGYSSADARRLVLLNHFRKNAGVTDPRVIELLLDNARMEIEETMQQWKQKPHIMALLEPEVQPVDPWEPEEYQRLCVHTSEPTSSCALGAVLRFTRGWISCAAHSPLGL